LRIGELLALRWQDIDLLKGLLSVNQTVYEGHFDEPKSKRSKRCIPLGPQCVEILAALKRTEATPSTLVFSARSGSPLSRCNLLNRQLKPAAKALKLTGVGWHWFRHAHAALLDSTGTPIGTTQALLGHSSSEIARGTYIHSVPADARRAVEDVERLLGTKGSLIGPKWAQVPIQAGTGGLLIRVIRGGVRLLLAELRQEPESEKRPESLWRLLHSQGRMGLIPWRGHGRCPQCSRCPLRSR